MYLFLVSKWEITILVWGFFLILPAVGSTKCYIIYTINPVQKYQVSKESYSYLFKPTNIIKPCEKCIN